LTALLGLFALILAISAPVKAEMNPFETKSIVTITAADASGKCGEGKADEKAKCGEGKQTKKVNVAKLKLTLRNAAVNS
jgi:uncharacterized low-complexity protein